MCRDDTPMVRRAAAAKLGDFAKVIGYWTSFESFFFSVLIET